MAERTTREEVKIPGSGEQRIRSFSVGVEEYIAKGIPAVRIPKFRARLAEPGLVLENGVWSGHVKGARHAHLVIHEIKDAPRAVLRNRLVDQGRSLKGEAGADRHVILIERSTRAVEHSGNHRRCDCKRASIFRAGK